VRTALLLSRAALFIGTDSGPMHLAAALGTTFLGLYGPTSPGHTAPRIGRGSALYAGFPCSPCDQSTCVRPADPCMPHHTAEEVFRVAAGILTHSAPVGEHG
jgi:heptosyltransferase I